MRWPGSYTLALALAAGCSFAPGETTMSTGDDANGSQVTVMDAQDTGSGSGSGDPASVAKCLSDASYTSRSGSTHSYKRIATNNKHFDDALDACYRDGGYLLSLDDASEAQYIKNTYGGNDWVSVSDQEVEKTFVSVLTGLPPAYSNFQGSEPNDSNGNEDCAVMNGDLTWNDTACDDNNPQSICECDPQFTPHTPPACRTMPNAVVAASRMYFKFEDMALSWQDAHAACAAIGATLIEISDAKENTAVGLGTDSWIGLSQNGVVWSWDDGTAYTYKTWQGADPQTTSMCAMQRHDNKNWEAHDCTTTHSYACECVP
ncbi:MAG: C-type lectin domain-containing protein [Kofleriaceae bacterium]